MSAPPVTPTLTIPLKSARDGTGGLYFIAPPLNTADLVVNLADFVIIVLHGKGNQAPSLVLRERVQAEPESG